MVFYRDLFANEMYLAKSLKYEYESFEGNKKNYGKQNLKRVATKMKFDPSVNLDVIKLVIYVKPLLPLEVTMRYLVFTTPNPVTQSVSISWNFVSSRPCCRLWSFEFAQCSLQYVIVVSVNFQ